jgi:catechol 2,3-dioxygenase-like lactoylglutathione lyase family enzyme
LLNGYLRNGDRKIKDSKMLNIEAVNHVGIRIIDKDRSVSFYQNLGFELIADVGFTAGHPIIMQHACGVVLNLLGPATVTEGKNILMDVDEKYAGYTHIALTVESLDDAKSFMQQNDIPVTGSFSFGKMSAIFIRDPDCNVIELDAYVESAADDRAGYAGHP